MALPSLICPKCSRKLTALVAPVITAHSYHDCLRKCEDCGVGYSNAAKDPTAIWRDPIYNVPGPVRAGVLQTLNNSFNEKNRGSKRIKFGFSTSEDAVTWTVFSYFIAEVPDSLLWLGRRWLGQSTDVPVPVVLLWGVQISPPSARTSIRDCLIRISDEIGESAVRRTEPDIVLDFDRSGVVIVEAKLGADNDKIKTSQVSKFDKYLSRTQAFSSVAKVKASKLYQLTRNWRFGWDLAEGRPMCLVNLAPSRLFKERNSLDLFECGIARSAHAFFRREAWENLLSGISREFGGLPVWLTDWLQTRKPPISVGS